MPKKGSSIAKSVRLSPSDDEWSKSYCEKIGIPQGTWLGSIIHQKISDLKKKETTLND